MYISPYIVQSLHEDRIRDGQQTARRRVISDKPAVSLFNRISHLLRVREVRATSDARHAHAI
ncbi:MAG: hypothetical protein GC204_17360 [Chloroflexi bacterium]|nr:hypothetical protein [Chloroflexota bacterium]